MIINITKSQLFTVDPDIRFSKEHNLPTGTLKEIYRRHKILDYSIDELCDYHEVKTGRKASRKYIRRWLWRIEVYSMTLPILKMGAETVVSTFFKEHEWKVIKEITRNLQSSVRKETKTLI